VKSQNPNPAGSRKPVIRRALREQKRNEASARRTARNQRSDEVQLQLLNERGAGDCKEASKIRQRLFDQEHPNQEPEKPTPPRKSRPIAKRRKVPASLM
jgi:hypothetical protein